MRQKLISIFLILVFFSCFQSAKVIGAEVKSKAVVFDFEIIDSSGEGEHPEHQQRIALVTNLLKELLIDTNSFEIVSWEPVENLIESRYPLHRCNGCETSIASQIGADYAFLGRINKVSTLILAVAITVTDTHRNVPVRAVRVGIRGDTDEAWSRGVRYIVKNKLNLEALEKPAGQ